jgi:hypothetical protein
VPPRDILFVLASLALPALLFLLVADYTTVDPSLESRRLPPIAHYVGVTALAILWFWFFVGSYLQRRMSMTRLALALFALAYVWLEPAIRKALAEPATACEGHSSIDGLACVGPVVPALVGLLPLAALLYLALGKSKDLLRWTPTGRAWEWYRNPMPNQRYHIPREGLDLLLRPTTFTVMTEAADVNSAAEFKRRLIKAGSLEAETPEGAERNFLLVTSRTKHATLHASLQNTPRPVPVICSPVRVAEALDAVWRLQWFDFRTWNAGNSAQARALSTVPESLTKTRVPTPVFLAHQAICSLASLHFLLTGGVAAASAAVASSASSAGQNAQGIAAFHQFVCTWASSAVYS